MVYVEHGYLVSGLYPSSSVQKNKSDKNTTVEHGYLVSGLDDG
jgi:hypothetical protein